MEYDFYKEKKEQDQRDKTLTRSTLPRSIAHINKNVHTKIKVNYYLISFATTTWRFSKKTLPAH